MSGNRLSSDGVVILFNALKSFNSSIIDIDLNDNHESDDECLISIGEYIKSNNYIKTISLNSTQVSDTGIEILAPYLDGNKTLNRLLFWYNGRITDKSVPMLLKMIESSHIEYIGAFMTSITQNSVLAVALAHNRIRYGSNIFNFEAM